LKSEYIHGKRFDTDEQLRQTLRTYFSFYNRARIHTSLSRMPPVSFELTKT
jgi:transposase InsO family protein